MTTKTREDWLTEATMLIELQILNKHELSLPDLWTVSVGFPAGSAKAIGQAFDKEACVDKKTHQMFISPVLGNHDIINLLHVILHESLHLAVGIDQKHGGAFKRKAREIGLEGKLTATYVSPDTPLYAVLQQIEKDIGYEYPHEAMIKQEKPKKDRVSNFAVLVSPEYPTYIIKIKKDVLEEFGFPCDPEGNVLEVLEDE